MKRYVLILSFIVGHAPLLVASEAAGFDFEFDEFPGEAVLESGAQLDRPDDSVRTGPDPLGVRAGKVCLTEDPDRGGVFLSHNSATYDAMGEPLSALTICMTFESDPLSSTSVFLQRMVKGSATTPGSFRFKNQSNTGDDNQRSGFLSFSVSDKNGESVSAMSASRWGQDKGTWYGVACVFDAGRVTFYLDGERWGEPVEMGLKEIPSPGEGTYYLRAGFGFQGAFDDLLILPGRALTDDEIRTVWEKGVAAVEPAKAGE